jgi:hypothetical protein
MITHNYGIQRRSNRSGDLTMWQLIALATAWGMMVVLTIIAMVQA